MSGRFAYLHGFASGPRSHKGMALAAAFARRGALLRQPDLNVPSFAHLTYSGMLAGVDRLDATTAAAGGDGETPLGWGLVGSSMGGWVAARWAELHPEKVSRLLLLAPGLDLPNRWRGLLSAAELQDWERSGRRLVNDAAGTSIGGDLPMVSAGPMQRTSLRRRRRATGRPSAAASSFRPMATC